MVVRADWHKILRVITAYQHFELLRQYRGWVSTISGRGWIAASPGVSTIFFLSSRGVAVVMLGIYHIWYVLGFSTNHQAFVSVYLCIYLIAGMWIRWMINQLPHPPPLDYSHTPLSLLSVSFSLRHDILLNTTWYCPNVLCCSVRVWLFSRTSNYDKLSKYVQLTLYPCRRNYHPCF